jgi:hypothetical protein
MRDKKFIFNWQLYFGVLLLVTGGLFLADQLLGVPLMGILWPLLVVLFGVTFFIGMLVAGRRGSGLAIPGSVITVIGLLLFIQNTFNLWVTWTYAWALIVVAVGVGMLIMNLYLRQVGLRRVAGLLIGIGLTLFVLFGVFFEIILDIAGTNVNSGLFLGSGLVLLGLFVIFSRALFRRTGSSRPASNRQEPAAGVEEAVFEDVDTPTASEDSHTISVDGDFTGLRFKCIGQVFLTQGNSCDLRIEASEDHLGKIDTRIEDGVLHIVYRSDVSDWTGLNWMKGERARYYVTLKSLDQLDLAGAAEITAEAIQGQSLHLRHSGAGSLRMQGLQVQDLTVDLTGLGEIKVSGTVEDQTITISGAGSYKAAALKSQTCDVTLSGAGSAEVWAEADLTTHISGAGSVKYKGSPSMHETKSGLGNVKPLSEA